MRPNRKEDNMQSVKWKIGKYKADANKAYEEISSLSEITPQNVVNLARDEKSVIHNDFEWNDEIAGEKYRNIQAGEMIRNFVIETKEEEKAQVRALQITTETNVYKPAEFFLKNEEEYQLLLRRALAELQGFKARYSSIAELEDVFNAIDAL